jgi:hypothetical protein
MKRIHLIAFAIGCLIGCQDKKEVRQGEVFPPEDELRAVDVFAAAQAAQGAREDATLYRHHFDAGKLNSLGQSKLHLMTTGRPGDEPVIVYLDLSEKDPMLSRRRQAVEGYLKDSGIAADRITLKTGPNLDNLHPAAPGLSRMNKTDSTPVASPYQMSSPSGMDDTGSKPAPATGGR